MARNRGSTKLKPGRTGTIESHPNRTDIEIARAAGISLDKIGARFGVSRSAVDRHWKSLTEEYRGTLVADIPREEIVRRATEESGSLLEHMKLARNVMERQLLAADVIGDRIASANLGRACMEANRDIGRLTGEIQRAMPGISVNTTVNNVSIIDTAQWRELAAGLLGIAREFPEAKGAIVGLVGRIKTIPEAPKLIEGHAHAA